jgi:hypothetical protein
MRGIKRELKGNLEIFDDFQTMPLADYFKVGGERAGDNLRGRSKDAPAMWAAQRKYEEKHEVHGVRADEEMDVGV